MNKNEYDRQARDFCSKYGVVIKRKYVAHDRYFGDDKESRDIYSVTISRKDKKSFTFRFGQSIADSKRHNPPTAYSILACLQKSEVGTFDDFCSDFGYNTDSKKAEKTYRAVVKEFSEVRRMFGDCLDDLCEIN